MSILTKNLFENKYFIAILIIVGIVVGIIGFMDYNSVESRCRRYVKERYVDRLISVSSRNGDRNRTWELIIKNAAELMIQDCIKRGGPR